MPHFQTAITRQLYGDNVFFNVLIERATLPEYDGVSFILFPLKKPYCPQGVLKATFDPSALTRKIGQYKLRLA